MAIIWFLHSNFPAQFRHLATKLAADPEHQIFYITAATDGNLPNVRKIIYIPRREPHPEIHHYVRPLEKAVLNGQAIAQVGLQLREKGFTPDIVYAHSGWGAGLFIKDIFPEARLLCYCEWFYRGRGADVDFDPAFPPLLDDFFRVRIGNAPILLDLSTCDKALTPTKWQLQQFPSEYHHKLTVLHDGIDTDYFCPQPNATLVLPSCNLDLSHTTELITYVARGMEPYRGFPQFIEAISLVQQKRPHCHVVILGQDRVAYGPRRKDGKTYKEYMLETVSLDLDRIHFIGLLPYFQYLKVLQASAVHVYLTYPFVLSWSVLEAMSTGCLIVASNTPPVQEVIEDGVNGLLVDFFSPAAIAERIIEALDNPDQTTTIRQQARQTIQERYDLSKLLPQHIDWMMS
jgi:glycosyltransferase involved in cell wall biosynthesis